MAKQKLTPQQWQAARREWESSPTESYGSVAVKYMISKALVGQRAAAEKWQKDVGATPYGKNSGAAPGIHNLQDAPSTRQTSASLDATGSQNSGQVGDVYRAPASDAEGRVDAVAAEYIANRTTPEFEDVQYPVGMVDAFERREFADAAIVRRQKQINALQRKELQAVKSKLYAAIRASDGKNGPSLALAVNRNIDSLKALHAEERGRELERVALTLEEYAGMPTRPNACLIKVVQHEGASFDEADNSPEAVKYRNEARRVLSAAKDELLSAGLTPVQAWAAIGRMRGAAALTGETVDVEAKEIQ
ncbi:hypothetical protein M0D68_06840 [Paraburkholderia sp. SEWSISQ10-3 4]|uniref:hypothetical protein n=1 Tax=Paraburkholderia TaxID=1822464 RepID=UPI002256E685|nr:MULTISPECIES: hypothetical protein [Paraburkholderia]MCX4137893.1 hypothetical protein [Paraburkholderia aspalathi]MDN7170584.1 hypothetical protein [Paraburkholderia sp. SEWSISQ10-3 4]MDQ6500223.1 hypothetical protein [Paraburkholderia aspalathi]